MLAAVRGHPQRMSTPWGKEEICNNADKSGQGEGGGVAVSGHPMSVVTVREKTAFKDHCIIIFLC